MIITQQIDTVLGGEKVNQIIDVTQGEFCDSRFDVRVHRPYVTEWIHGSGEGTYVRFRHFEDLEYTEHNGNEYVSNIKVIALEDYTTNPARVMIGLTPDITRKPGIVYLECIARTDYSESVIFKLKLNVVMKANDPGALKY